MSGRVIAIRLTPVVGAQSLTAGAMHHLAQRLAALSATIKH
jgi:hypothetical protein